MENNNRQGCRWTKASERTPTKVPFVIKIDGEIDSISNHLDFDEWDGGKRDWEWLDESIEPCAGRFKSWLEERIENYEMEKSEHGKKERIQARLSMLKETLENYNRWIEPCATSLERIKELELGIIRMHENMLLGNHVEANRIGLELLNK